MNGRKLFREYAQSKGKKANEFVRVDTYGYGESDILVTKDESGNKEHTSIDYKEMVHWIIKQRKSND